MKTQPIPVKARTNPPTLSHLVRHGKALCGTPPAGINLGAPDSGVHCIVCEEMFYELFGFYR